MVVRKGRRKKSPRRVVGDIAAPSPRVDEKEDLFTAAEKRQLRSVYLTLANWGPVSALREEQEMVREEKRREEYDKRNQNEKKIDVIEALNSKLDKLSRDILAAKQREGVIEPKDLHAAFNQLGVETRRHEALDLIWQIDENLDEKVDMEEFMVCMTENKHLAQNMRRIKAIPAGFRLFILVQFLASAHTLSGFLSHDEAVGVVGDTFGIQTEASLAIRKINDAKEQVPLSQFLVAIERYMHSIVDGL